MKMPPSAMNLPLGSDHPSAMGQGLYTGLTANSTNFNDVAEFEIYDRKFKQ